MTPETIFRQAEHMARTLGIRHRSHNGHSRYALDLPNLTIWYVTDGELTIYRHPRAARQTEVFSATRNLTGEIRVHRMIYEDLWAHVLCPGVCEQVAG